MDPVHAVSCGPCHEHGARQVLNSEVGLQRIPAAGDTEGTPGEGGTKGHMLCVPQALWYQLQAGDPSLEL